MWLLQQAGFAANRQAADSRTLTDDSTRPSRPNSIWKWNWVAFGNAVLKSISCSNNQEITDLCDLSAWNPVTPLYSCDTGHKAYGPARVPAFRIHREIAVRLAACREQSNETPAKFQQNSGEPQLKLQSHSKNEHHWKPAPACALRLRVAGW